MNTITVSERQTLLDVAVIATGSVEGAFAMAVANNLPIDYAPANGTTLQVPEIINPEVVSRYQVHHINPATAAESSTLSLDIIDMPEAGTVETVAVGVDLCVFGDEGGGFFVLDDNSDMLGILG